MTGEEGGRGVRAGTSIADMTAGMYAAYGIMLALRVKERTGRGQAIDVSMLEGQMSLLGTMIGGFVADGELPAPMGTAYKALLPYQTFRTKTRDLALAVGSEKLWQIFCPAIGRPELAERSALSPQRRPREESRHAHPAAPGGLPDQDLRGMGGDLPAQGHPLRRHQQHRAGRRASAGEGPRRPRGDAAPARGQGEDGRGPGAPVRDAGLGADTVPHAGRAHDEVLRELLGMSPEAVAALRDQGVIGGPPTL